MRIVTCTNSAARISYAAGEPDLLPAGPGGVVPMVAALMRRYGGDWVFPIAGSADYPSVSVTNAGVTTRLHPHPIAPDLAEQHNRQISIKVLQWLFHYLHQPPYAPMSSPAAAAAWAGYCEVNRQIAERLSRLRQEAHHEIVLINDHQLLLVPEFFRRAAPGGTLVYFHQLSWCEPEYFALLPRFLRTRILRSLLACDVIGFHARRWADAFLRCCERDLPEVEVGDSEVDSYDRRVRVVATPGPIDRTALARVRTDPATGQWRDWLAHHAAGRQVVVRAERFDLWKNVGRGLLAYEQLLRRQPQRGADTWLCAMLSPPRCATERHRADRTWCEALAARINARFGQPGREPVSLLYPRPADNTHHRVVAALELNAATMVNPTYDGLNLVALESLLLSPTAPVILSVNTGAYELLAGHAQEIDPFDVAATADALDRALGDGAPIPGWSGAAVPTAKDWLRALLPAT